MEQKLTRVSLRHGDVVLVRIDALPKEIKKPFMNVGGSFVVAEGEVTGHHHMLHAQTIGIMELTEQDEINALIEQAHNIIDNSDSANLTGKVFNVVGDDVSISHQEHKKLGLESGIWVEIREREWNNFSKMASQVRD